jgi:type IV fimbrial biogenesis protein FimT
MMHSNSVRTSLRMPARGSDGFTLVELTVVISIVAVLSFLAAPSMRELMANQRVQAAATDVFTGLIRARSEALKQNVDVTLSSTSGTTNWANGWKVSDGTTDFDKRGASSDLTITGSAASVTYRNNGRISAGTIPTVSISATGTTAVRSVKVNLSGQPYVTKTTCS